MEQIELEMATKVVMFERKLSKHKITLKLEYLYYDKFEAAIQKAKETNDWGQIPKCTVDFNTDISKVDLQIKSKSTINELSKAIVEVCHKQNYFLHF